MTDAIEVLNVAVECYAPIRTVSEMNSRCHWRVRHARFKKQAQEIRYLLASQKYPPPQPPCIVTFIRHSAGVLDDDNLRSAMKACRDAVAAFLGVDDGSASVTWRYDQVKAKRGVYGVTVRIEEATA